MSTTAWKYIAVSEIVPNMKAQTNLGGNTYRPSRGLGGSGMGGGRRMGNMGSPYNRGRGNMGSPYNRGNRNHLMQGTNNMMETKIAGRLAGGSNIKIELEEIESGDQAYPATCGFLTLLAELIRWEPPEEAGIKKHQLVYKTLSHVWTLFGEMYF